jgi:molybdopterin converting factor small subunit
MHDASLRELCSQIAAEKNSEKLVDLISELRALLAEQKAESEKKADRQPSLTAVRNN